ncbi:alpha/beta hydrolase-fold protein [Smaragdicoccus niigatensis]|uniref:alpha/beta hydrolase-fold protein n=1 Tax=Smaragdicoccus niigatensis TaxID=359359 RepID=UPI00036CAD61|nr:alpha/beta hydrolase-fold protein [Smaragdicoccus niigatensis]
MLQNRGLSLLGGWFPVVVEVVTVVVVAIAIARRNRRWWIVWLPICVAVGGATFAATAVYVHSEGLSSDPAPKPLWAWVWVFGSVVAALILGFRSARWWRRGLMILAVPLAAMCVLLVLNQWVGYFPTVQAAWGAVTSGPLPDEVDASDLPALRNTAMTTGKIVAIDTGDAGSDFRHRTEYVYLPPSWFVGATPPTLPAVLMIAGEFNTPADWIRSGNIVPEIDAYAKSHGGQTPEFVFVDAGGTFNNDTECVDGPRGNAHSHLVNDVRPYVVNTFGVSPKASAWGVVGWSMGGTCALDLTVMRPDLFSSFEDIAGDAGPTAGTKDQTVSRLFGGSESDWEHYDPATVMRTHGTYQGVSAWFADTGNTPPRGARGFHRPPGQWKPPAGFGRPAPPGATGLGGVDGVRDTGEVGAAEKLCTQAKSVSINCQVHTESSRHSWQFAEAAFTEALPWMAGVLHV